MSLDNEIIYTQDIANINGMVSNIQRFCIHDGPGIRTTVFLKGCPLGCKWCSNPELQVFDKELFYSPNKCLHCQRCVEICPANALEHDANGLVVIREKCIMCGKCFPVCYPQALTKVGEEKSVQQVMEVVLRDQVVYNKSGGGLTLSGGEPMVQLDFVYALLLSAKQNNVSTAMETCGFTAWENFKRIIPLTDYFLYDLKHLDNCVHQEMTGVSNDIILRNLQKLSECCSSKVIVRIPVISGFNYQKEVIQLLLQYTIKCEITEVHLLPYHELGIHKYKRLNRAYFLEEGQKVSTEKLTDWIKDYEKSLKIVIGG